MCVISEKHNYATQIFVFITSAVGQLRVELRPTNWCNIGTSLDEILMLQLTTYHEMETLWQVITERK